MYAFVDRSAGRLCEGSRFLLWAMRGWAQCVAQKRCPPGSLASAFISMRALPALPDFHTAMILLSRDAKQRFVFAPIGCARIGEDEALLLALWRDLVADEGLRTRTTLGYMVDAASIEPLVQAMTDTVASLSVAGMLPRGLRAPGRAR